MYFCSCIRVSIPLGIDFGITQLVDGNWGVHAVVPKAVFEVETKKTSKKSKKRGKKSKKGSRVRI